MRGRAAALLTALLAVSALAAAKPLPPAPGPDDGPDQARERWRGQGISLCVGELRAIPALTPDDLEGICGCAVDRYLRGQGNRPEPELRLQGALESQMVACTARIRPERAADVARLRIAAAPQSAAPPAAVQPPPQDGKPTVEDEAPAEAEGESAGGGLWAWLGNLSWPAWLTGASVLWWIALGIFVVGMLILKFRRRDPRKDLSAPPSYMRRGAPPQPPRRPDLPR